jgi:hypothetical protein
MKISKEVTVRWVNEDVSNGTHRSVAKAGPNELLAYDDGRWEVRGPPLRYGIAGGKEVDGGAAKRRAVLVYIALMADCRA